jgi:hypothetical protein
MARTVEQITTARWVKIKEDARNNDDLLLQTGLKEVETVGDGARQAFEIEPQVECTIRHVFDHETHVTQALDHVITLVLLEYATLENRRPVP